MLFVRERGRQWVIKYTGRFVKVYAMFLQVRSSFAVIPGEDQLLVYAQGNEKARRVERACGHDDVEVLHSLGFRSPDLQITRSPDLLPDPLCLNENVIRVLKLLFPLEAKTVIVTGIVQLPVGKYFQQVGIHVGLKVLS